MKQPRMLIANIKLCQWKTLNEMCTWLREANSLKKVDNKSIIKLMLSLVFVFLILKLLITTGVK